MKTFLIITFILIQTIPLSFQAGPIADGLYMIINKQSLDGLDVERASTEPGAKIIIYPPIGDVNQHFHVKNVEGNYYTIVSAKSSLAVTSYDNSVSSSLEQHEIEGSPSSNQLFEFLEAGPGYYVIRNKASGLYINGDSYTSISEFYYQLAIQSLNNCSEDLSHLMFYFEPVW